jgi:acetylornithine/N-succinyldiaminopimelate aminotransferase
MFSKRQLFLQHVAQTSDFPMCLEVSHASGMYIYGTDGKKYLDFDSGISVSSVGHCHPAVVNAVKMQAETYMHTMVYGEHIQAPQVEYATLLSEVLNNGLNSVYYVNSGSEAVETAIKLARKARGRYEIISCANAYHGSTIAAESLRSDTAFTKHFVPTMPGVRHIRFNNETDLAKITNNTACVILEPVQAEAGIIVPENDYLQKVRTRCQQTGTLMILDEIQTGFGRTGEMFAHQKYGITPDILLIAKGMGGGMPIGGVVASTDLMMHFASQSCTGAYHYFRWPSCMCSCCIGNYKTTFT